MLKRQSGFQSALLFVLLQFFAVVAIAQSEDRGTWHPFGGIGDGCAGSVRAEAVAANGDLYVGGAFRACGDVAASTVARWDGSHWSTLGAGTNGTVYAIAVAGSDVYVAGTFTYAGGVAANNIARWDGSWHALGSGIASSGGSSQVSAIAVLGTDVYIGGVFDTAGGAAASGIARWNTVEQTWSAMGAGVTLTGAPGTVNALAAMNGQLYAGGHFDHAGATAADDIAMWDGTTWSGLGAGTNGIISALAVTGNTLYVGGTFSQAGGIAAAQVAIWNGTNWTSLGSAPANGLGSNVRALAIGSDGLYAGGQYFGAGGVSQGYIARWDGSVWHDLGAGVSPARFSLQILALAVAHQKVYAGGRFDAVGSASAHFIASWDGAAWSTLGAPADTGIASAVNALATYAGKTCAGSAWPAAYDQGELVCWDGASWSAVGGNPFNPLFGVSSLFASGNDLYIGNFGTAGSCCLAGWNGVNYVPVGTSGTAGMDSDVLAVIASGGIVYAGGDFSQAGASSASGLAYWDGSAWHGLGAGYDVDALALLGGKLYAGTTFGSVLVWDGATGTPSVGTFDGSVNALLAVNNALYAGGSFAHVDGIAANGLARWDGTSWSGLVTPSGNGVAYHGAPGTVLALTSAATVLYVGGQFDTAAGIAANDVVRWDGTSFSSLGADASNGVESNGYVDALSVNGTDVYIGGQFGVAGGQVSSGVARYTPDRIFSNSFE